MKSLSIRWTLIFFTLLLTSSLYWLMSSSHFAGSLWLLVLSLGAPVHLMCYIRYQIADELARHGRYINRVLAGACLFLGAHTLLNIGLNGVLNHSQLYTVLAYFSAILLTMMLLVLTVKCAAPLASKHRMTTALVMLCVILILIGLGIPNVLMAIALYLTDFQAVTLQWHGPISLIFLVQIVLAIFLILFSLAMKMVSKVSVTFVPLSFSFVMALNGFIGLAAVFALHFQ